jgi:hypothetical protein
MARAVAIQYGPNIIPVSVRLPISAKESFEQDTREPAEILSACKSEGLFHKSMLLPYQFRYETINIGIPRNMAEELYQTMPINSDSNNLSRFVGVMLSRHYNVEVPPLSGRLATQTDNKLNDLMIRVEKALK